MKTNIFFLLFTFLYITNANATIDTVHVMDHQFVPAAFDALVGDTVLWVWDNGTHTTTGTEVNIPQGAATWDAPIDAVSQTFQYVITTEGQYFYFSRLDVDMSASFKATGTLPVKLTNFTITNTANNKALLTWNTVTEQNTSCFSIQRSTDAIKFIETGRVNAAGNSATLKSYSYTDNNISTANRYLYYKIVTIDKDGKSNTSNVVAFKNNTAITKLITALSPNPVSNPCNLNVQFNADKQGKMFIQVYNVGGNLIKQKEIEASAGLNNAHLYLDNLPTGIYKIQFRLHDETDIKTIVVQ